MSRHSAPRIPHPALRRGQASLEMAAAIVGALTLLFGVVRFAFWCAERYVARMQAYDLGRAAAASVPFAPDAPWDGSYEPTEKLDILNERGR